VIALLKWLNKNAKALQSLGVIFTAIMAIVALVGIKYQVDASARLQREQSARDIYREFLNLSISRPELADPDYCAIKESPQASAYFNYVDYLLYTSEQMLAASPDWEPTLNDHLAQHSSYLCAMPETSDYPSDVSAMLDRFRAKTCKQLRTVCD
jgi:hypothetical protein